MDELCAFLAARLDEEEAAAQDMARGHPAPWSADDCFINDADGHLVLYDEHHWSSVRYFARQDPAKRLREVAVKRERLALYTAAKAELAEALRNAPEESPATAHSHVRERINVNRASGRFTALEISVRLDAAAYEDHPDYRAEWRSAMGHDD